MTEVEGFRSGILLVVVSRTLNSSTKPLRRLSVVQTVHTTIGWTEYEKAKEEEMKRRGREERGKLKGKGKKRGRPERRKRRRGEGEREEREKERESGRERGRERKGEEGEVETFHLFSRR